MQRLIQAQQQLEADGLSLPALLGRAALVGLTFGTAFQVTHNNGLLPVQSRHPGSPFALYCLSMPIDIASSRFTVLCILRNSFLQLIGNE